MVDCWGVCTGAFPRRLDALIGGSQETFLHYRRGQLYLESLSLEALGQELGTPLYLYSQGAIESQVRALREALHDLPGQLYYSVKANSNAAILELLRDLGVGFDVVSGGELERCLRAGAAAQNVVFAGVGKTDAELRLALRTGVGLLHVESLGELQRLDRLAAQESKPVALALRCNFDVDAHTHPHITTGRRSDKFGLPVSHLTSALERIQASPQLQLRGLHVHLGSQVTEAQPFARAAQALAHWVGVARQHAQKVHSVNLGGGLPVDEESLGRDYLPAIAAAVRPHLEDLDVAVCWEPGRFLVAPAGVLLTRVIEVKSTPSTTFAVVDAGMSDFLRPALYQAEHPLWSVAERNAREAVVEVVGPVCESADRLALHCRLQEPQTGDYLAVGMAGAYGFSMSSNYNSRPRPAEYLLHQNRFRCIRKRESVEQLIALEQTVADSPWRTALGGAGS